MNLQALVPVALTVSVPLSVFSIGLAARRQDATDLFRSPADLFRALLAMNLLMPLLAVALVLAFDLDPAVKIALVALSISPTPPLLPKRVPRGAGADSRVVALLVAASLLAIVFVPLAMEVLERVFGVPLEMTVASVALLVGLTVLLPLGLGLAVHGLAPVAAGRLAGPISQLSGLGVLGSVCGTMFLAAPEVWMLIGNGTILALVGFVVAGFAIGHVLGGPREAGRIALGFSTASRHPGIALAIAEANFVERKLATAALLLYLVVNIGVSIPYNRWMQRRGKIQS